MFEKLAFLRWSRLSTAAVVIYWSAMLLGTHLPARNVPATPYSDKTLHFVAYAGLAFLLSWTWTTRRRFLWCGPLFALAVAAGYGGLDEFTQTFIPGRYGDVVDWYYDTAGAAMGIVGFWIIERSSRWLHIVG